MTTTAPMTDADELLRAAHGRTYRLPPGFHGFTATVRLHTGNPGTVVVRSPAGTCLTVGAPELERRWARAELTSMASHRWAASYDEGDGRWAKVLEPDDGHPLGRLVRLVGDRFESSYRIAGGLVTQVDRRIGRTRFTVATKQREEAGDGRTLPTQFTVAHWSADDGRLLHADTCTDAYTRVDGLRTRQLTLSDHLLLTAEGYGSAAS